MTSKLKSPIGHRPLRRRYRTQFVSMRFRSSCRHVHDQPCCRCRRCVGRRWRCGYRLLTSQPKIPRCQLRLRRRCLIRFVSMRFRSSCRHVHDQRRHRYCRSCWRRWRCDYRLLTSQPNGPTSRYRFRRRCRLRFVSMRFRSSCRHVHDQSQQHCHR